MEKVPQAPKFLDEMKQRLVAERAQLRQRLGHEAHQEHGNYQANMPDYGRNDEENAMEVADYTANAATTEAEESRLKEVEAALQRITQGTYGRTLDGQSIPEERLRANPAATTIVKPAGE